MLSISRVDSFLHACGAASGSPVIALVRNCRAVIAKHFTDCTEFFRRLPEVEVPVARVQVVDRRVYAVHRHLHATYCAFARRSNHVCAIGCCAVTDDFRIDMRRA